MEKNYLFKSERLGFRNWLDSDIPAMIELNANPNVMEFFPSIPSPDKTKSFIKKMQNQFREKGFCYFAVDKLEDGAFIGFIGLSEQTYEADFTPCIDIGWRLKEQEWNKGFATEGAKKCLDFAFHTLKLDQIHSIAPVVNINSERVMKKIGMTKISTFEHPLLLEDERLKNCVVYQIKKS